MAQAGATGNGVTTNGHRTAEAAAGLSQDAQEVRDYTLKTLDLIVKWMDEGWKDKESPACRWEGTSQLAKARSAGGKGKGRENVLRPSSEPITEEQLFSILSQTLHDSVNPWTRRFLDKLYAAPTTLSPAIELLSASLNASTAVTSAAPALCLAEEQTVEQFASLLGWDPTIADGLTMPGGSSSNFLAVQTALGNAFPSYKQGGILGVVSDLTSLYGRQGRAARPLLLTSEQSHYSLEKSALACGMGLDSVVKVKCDAKGKMDLADLERILKEASINLDGKSTDEITAGFPFFINATAGTTILGAFDDIEGIIDLAQKHSGNYQQPPIWVHADGSWGGPVIFSSQSSHLMKGVSRVDSLTINPHKILNVTQQCSFALFREGDKLGVNVTGAKYLFHGAKSGKPTREYLRNNPAAKTMGCARRADAFKFYVEWLRVGTRGFEEHVERGISYAEKIVNLILSEYADTLEVSVATPEPAFLQVCFRPIYSSALEKDMLPSLSSLGEDPIVARSKMLSIATHHVHAKLRSLGKYQVDKAPVHYPADTGYYMRLVTHPSTPFDILEDVVAEIDRIGQEYFAKLQSDLASLEDDQEKRKEYIQQLLLSDE